MAYEVNDFQHEEDSNMASNIFNSTVVQAILRQLQQSNIERIYTYLYAASCPQLTEKTSPTLYRNLIRACELFGLNKVPKIFVTRNYREMVSAIGVSEPFILFSSEYLRKLDKETLFGILAGQVAAIRCEHHRIVYIAWALEFGASYFPLPGSSVAVGALINNWKRSRYFTYDRAFALATGNRTLSLRQILINVVPQQILDKMEFGTDCDMFAAQVEFFIKGMSNAQSGFRKAVELFSDKDWLPLRYNEINKFFNERRDNHVAGLCAPQR